MAYFLIKFLFILALLILIAYELAKYYLPLFFIAHFKASFFEQSQNQALYRIIERLFSDFQVALPKLYLIDDNCAYCFSVATTSYRSYLFVSKPMISILNEMELQAVFTREAEKIKRDRSKINTFTVVVLNRLMSPLRMQNKELKSESIFHIFYGLTVLPWVRIIFKNNWFIQNQRILDATVLKIKPGISTALRDAYLKIMKCNRSKSTNYSIDAIETLFPISLELSDSTILGDYFEYDPLTQRLEAIENKYEKDV